MKKIIALAMALVMILAVACASADVAVSWYTFGDAFLSVVRESLNDALAAKGLTPNNMDSNTNQQQQTDAITTAAIINDAVVVNLVDSSASGTAANIMAICQEAGKPFVFFNRSIAQTDAEAEALCKEYGTWYVGTVAEEAGMMQGDMIGDYVLANYDAIDLNGDGVISYIMFKGDDANQEAIYRTQYGVENADAKLTAAGKPALSFYDAANAKKYLVDMDGAWSAKAAQEYMQAALAQYSEANGNMIELVICNNDEMALGAINALAEAGYNDGKGKSIPVFGVDATDPAKEKIAQGVMVGTIKQDAAGMADAVATIIANLIAGNDALADLNPSYKVVDGWRINIPYAAYTGE